MIKFLVSFLLLFSVNVSAALLPTLHSGWEYYDTTSMSNSLGISVSEVTTGSLSRYEDKFDIYAFRWDGGLFIADTRPDDRYPQFKIGEFEYAHLFYSDTVLTLFDINGNTIASNDNWHDSVLYAKIKLELDPGAYYLGVSRSTYSEFDINQVSDYTNLPNVGLDYTYVINKTTSIYGNYSTRSIVEDVFPVEPSRIPEPSVIALLLIGFIGMIAFIRVRRK